jgi:hypothetical protein
MHEANCYYAQEYVCSHVPGVFRSLGMSHVILESVCNILSLHKTFSSIHVNHNMPTASLCYMTLIHALQRILSFEQIVCIRKRGAC